MSTKEAFFLEVRKILSNLKMEARARFPQLEGEPDVEYEEVIIEEVKALAEIYFRDIVKRKLEE